jgi:secondary thiamine-phosphate synthase enzyme
MRQHLDQFSVRTARGLTDITARVRRVVETSGIRRGMCTITIRHTSASLVIQENADPKVLVDLEAFLTRLVPDGDPLFTHCDEGEDDMPSHVKAAVTRTSEQIPIDEGALMLGTWQGLFVWDHRHRPRERRIVVHVLGE